MSKFIREIRMGPPKAYKTGIVVSTYPRPMLVFEGDEGGLDVIKDPIVWLTPETFVSVAAKPPPLTAFQFAKNPDLQLQDLFGPIPDKDSFPAFNSIGNMLFKTKPLPWKTVVIDPITMLSNSILSYFSQTNARQMSDARKWASAVGLKTSQVISAFFTLQCHVVCIMHTSTNRVVNEKGEVTRETAEPAIYSKAREMLGSLPSQFFYQYTQNIAGKRACRLQTVADSRIVGIGARWPSDLPSDIDDPTFQRVYGASVKSGECAV